MPVRFTKPAQQPNTPDGCALSTETLDAMSLDELRQALEEYLDKMTEESYNPAIIDAYLDAIDRKEPPPVFQSTEQSFQDFQERLHKLETSFGEIFPENPPSDVKRQSHRRSWRKAWVTAGMAAVLVCLLAVSVSAGFRTWIRETYEGSFVYRFFNEEIPDAVLPDYEITDLPEGYELVVNDSADGLGMKLYSSSASDIVFMYCRADDAGNMLIDFPDGLSSLDIPITVHSEAANFYKATDPNTPNEIVWINKQDNVIFTISGFFDQEILVKMAESVTSTHS